MRLNFARIGVHNFNRYGTSCNGNTSARNVGASWSFRGLQLQATSVEVGQPGQPKRYVTREIAKTRCIRQLFGSRSNLKN